jgi:outer membrane protein assembly factor BamB
VQQIEAGIPRCPLSRIWLEGVKNMNKTLTIAATLLFALGLVACGGGKAGISRPEAEGVYGTYANEDDPSEYLELNEDGKFFLKEMGVGYSGEWDIENDTITLHMGEMGLAARAALEDGRIVNEEGKVWVKKAGAQEATPQGETGEGAPGQGESTPEDAEETSLPEQPGLLWTFGIGADAAPRLSMSYDGRHILVTGIEDKIWLLDRRGRTVRIFSGSAGLISADGSHIVVSNEDALCLYDRSGKSLWCRQEFASSIPELSDDASFIASLTQEPSITKVSLLDRSGTQLWRRELEGLYSGYGYVLSADGSSLAVVTRIDEPCAGGAGNGTECQRLYLLDRSGEILWTRDLDAEFINSVALSGDGSRVAVVHGADRQLLLFDRLGNLLWTATAEPQALEARYDYVGISSDGSYIVVTRSGEKIDLFDGSGTLLWSREPWPPFPGEWPSLSIPWISPSGSHIAVAAIASMEDRIFLFDVTGNLVWDEKRSHFWDFSVSSDGSYVLTDDNHGNVYFFYTGATKE